MRTLAPGIHCFEHPLRVGGAALGSRSIVIDHDGGQVLVAPSDLSDEQMDAIDARGPVHAILAPNAWHHLFLDRALARWPDAFVRVSPGLLDKRPDLANQPPFDARFEGFGLRGLLVEGAPKISEMLLLHEASRTLFITDLCFNVQEARGWTWLFLWLNGAVGRFGPSRFAKSMMADKAAVGAAVDEVLTWPFDRIVVQHGEAVIEEGPTQLREAFAFTR